jgi:hypothetical protein
MSANFGTDTIRLYSDTNQLRLEPEFRADIPNEVDNETGELKYKTPLCETTDGETVRGMMVKIRTKSYQFSLTTSKDNRRAATVQFSAGAYRESNLEPSNLEHVMDVITTIESDLAARGIHWALNEARVATLASNRNPIMAEPCGNYMPCLRALGVRKKVNKTEYGPTGQRLGNKQWDSLFYDKREEMASKGYDISVCPENLLRGEIEWSKSAVVLKATGIKTVATIPQNWGNIEPAFKRVMKTEIFKPRTDSQCQKAAFDLSKMLSAAADKPRPFATLTHEYGLLSLIRDEGLERAKWLISEQLGDTTTKAGRVVCERWFRELEDAAARLELHKLASSGVSNVELYKELKAKMTE